MFITIHDRGNIDSILANWPEEDVKVGSHLVSASLAAQVHADSHADSVLLSSISQSSIPLV